MISRAIQNKGISQIQNYKSNKGAYKVIESKSD
jgi:hypothetical protein